MPSTAELQAAPFKRGEKVSLVDDLPHRPAGSVGKVALANGFTWRRYWVRFGDDDVVGHIDHSKLVRAKDYDEFVDARARELVEAELAAEHAETQAEESTEVAAAATTGGTVVNGVTIPPHLIERSAAARQRLGG